MTRATTSWEIDSNGTPVQLKDEAIDLEKTLETWVETHPGLVEPGLKILARQLKTDSGPIDLLGIDEDGRLVIIELKRERAYREALAQALDYAACIAALDYSTFESKVNVYRNQKSQPELRAALDELLGEDALNWTPDEPRILLVGTGADESLVRIINYMTSRYDVPVNGVFFDVSKTLASNILLTRIAVVSDEQAAMEGRGRRKGDHDALMQRAASADFQDAVGITLQAWRTAGHHVRPESSYWSLAAKSAKKGRVFQLFPTGTADKPYLQLDPERAKPHLPGIDMKASLRSTGMVVHDDNTVAIDSVETANKLAAWIQAKFAIGQTPATTPAAPVSQ